MAFSKHMRFLLLQASLILHVLAQGCWRNTTCTGPAEPSFPGVWEKNIYSPASRTVSPVRVLDSNDCFLSDYPGVAELQGNNSLLIFDFGEEVGGIVTVTYTASGSGSLGLAFTEAKNFTGENSDESNGGSGPDLALYADIAAPSPTASSYTMPLPKLRGGFRYLTLFTLTNDTVSVNIGSITLEIGFQPTWSNLRAYGGYFHSNDELLNRIWYACTYTVQTNAIPPTTGREWGPPPEGWLNDAYLGVNGDSVLVDGAKRDRGVWAGDLAISIPTALVGTGDFDSVRNALQVQYNYQNLTTGELPTVGPPISFFGSDTYHMATMIATHDYVLYSNDIAYLKSIWGQYKHAMNFITGKIDGTGLLNVTGTSTWGRAASDAGHSTDGNMLLYGVLTTGSTLSHWAGEPDLANGWEATAATLKAAANVLNWDNTVGAFKNSDVDASIYPEDGNSFALFFGGANSSHAEQVSTELTTNWGPIGAITPEQPGNIVPFVESFEIKGHLVIRQTQRALDLMRLSWGWYINNPYGTGSTMIEGYYEDGSFNYANDGYDKVGSYPSHAHGWSTGPTEALISYVLGLRPTAPGGSTWMLAPQFGDLTAVQGGFTTPTGKFSASWTLSRRGYTLEWDVPAGTTGTLVLPSYSRKPQVSVNGRRDDGCEFDSSSGLTTMAARGGKHTVTVRY